MTFGSRLTNIIISEKEYCLYEGRIHKNITKNTLINLPLYKLEDNQFLFTTLPTKNCEYVCDYPIRAEQDENGLFIDIHCNYKKKKRFILETPVWLDPIHLEHIIIC